MARAKPNGAAAVDAWFEVADHPHLDALRALRRLVLETDARLREDVKWNAPSFILPEPFGDHLATFRTAPHGRVQVVLHLGAAARRPPPALAAHVPDPAGLLVWAAPDRASVDFVDAAGVARRGPAFAEVLKAWIAAACLAKEGDPA